MTFSLDLDTSIDIMLAITLSAATGFRVFVPLLILSAAAVFGHIDLPSKFDWIENPQALTLFGTAATTGGLANPIFALLELAISTCLSLLAITLPLVAGAICEAGAYRDLFIEFRFV